MTRRSVALADGWSVKGYLSTDAAVEAAAHAWDGEGWLPARVPGSIAHDVWQAGEAPSPYHERDSLALEWVAQRAWRYRRAITVPSLAGGEAAWLRFAGVDHAATVLLDGEVVAQHEGMFVPFEVPLPAPGAAIGWTSSWRRRPSPSRRWGARAACGSTRAGCRTAGTSARD